MQGKNLSGDLSFVKQQLYKFAHCNGIPQNKVENLFSDEKEILKLLENSDIENIQKLWDNSSTEKQDSIRLFLNSIRENNT